jgi:hypothetical protein
MLLPASAHHPPLSPNLSSQMLLPLPVLEHLPSTPPHRLPLPVRLEPTLPPATNSIPIPISSDHYRKDGSDVSIILDVSTMSTIIHVRPPGTDLVTVPVATLPLKLIRPVRHEQGTISVHSPTTCWRPSPLRMDRLAALLLRWRTQRSRYRQQRHYCWIWTFARWMGTAIHSRGPTLLRRSQHSNHHMG